MADWDDEDFEPGEVTSETKTTDKWEGEDEDEDVKDNWDDDDESEKKDESKQTVVIAPKKKKKTLKEILKEKEEQKLLEAQKKAEERKHMQEEEDEELTPEEQMAEKLRRQRLVEESDLLLAVDTFGGGEVEEEQSGTSLDTMKPKTREEYMEFSKLLVTKLTQFQSSAEYIPFLEETLRELCVTMEPDDIKRLSTTLNLLQSEKLKAQKGKKAKSKAAKKATLTGAAKMGRKDELDYSYGDLGNEFDDFM